VDGGYFVTDKKTEQPVTTEFEAAGEAQDKTKEIITEGNSQNTNCFRRKKTITGC
jgi:hypothetical protein